MLAGRPLPGRVVRLLLRDPESDRAWSGVEGARAHVAGEDHDRAAEIDAAPSPVGELTFVQDLQQELQHARMGFLHLVEEHDACRPPPDRLGQLTSLSVADVPRRRSDQTRDAVRFRVFR